MTYMKPQIDVLGKADQAIQGAPKALTAVTDFGGVPIEPPDKLRNTAFAYEADE